MRLFFCRFHSDSQFYGFFVHDAHVLTVVVAKKCFTRRKTLNCYHTTIIRCSLRSTCFGECQAFHIISMSYISHSAQPTVSYHFFLSPILSLFHSLSCWVFRFWRSSSSTVNVFDVRLDWHIPIHLPWNVRCICSTLSGAHTRNIAHKRIFSIVQTRSRGKFSAADYKLNGIFRVHDTHFIKINIPHGGNEKANMKNPWFHSHSKWTSNGTSNGDSDRKQSPRKKNEKWKRK